MTQRPTEPWDAFGSGMQMWQEALTQMQLTFLEQMQQLWDMWINMLSVDIGGPQGSQRMPDPWTSMLNIDLSGRRSQRSRGPGQIDQSAGARDWTEPAR